MGSEMCIRDSCSAWCSLAAILSAVVGDDVGEVDSVAADAVDPDLPVVASEAAAAAAAAAAERGPPNLAGEGPS